MRHDGWMAIAAMLLIVFTASDASAQRRTAGSQYPQVVEIAHVPEEVDGRSPIGG